MYYYCIAKIAFSEFFVIARIIYNLFSVHLEFMQTWHNMTNEVFSHLLLTILLQLFAPALSHDLRYDVMYKSIFKV